MAKVTITLDTEDMQLTEDFKNIGQRSIYDQGGSVQADRWLQLYYTYRNHDKERLASGQSRRDEHAHQTADAY